MGFVRFYVRSLCNSSSTCALFCSSDSKSTSATTEAADESCACVVLLFSVVVLLADDCSPQVITFAVAKGSGNVGRIVRDVYTPNRFYPGSMLRYHCSRASGRAGLNLSSAYMTHL